MAGVPNLIAPLIGKFYGKISEHAPLPASISAVVGHTSISPLKHSLTLDCTIARNLRSIIRHASGCIGRLQRRIIRLRPIVTSVHCILSDLVNYFIWRMGSV